MMHKNRPAAKGYEQRTVDNLREELLEPGAFSIVVTIGNMERAVEFK
jgi:hypothetical protein